MKIGGAETQALNLAKGLKKMGFINISFLILSSEKDGPLIEELSAHRIPFQSCDFSTYNIDFFKDFPLFSFSKWQLFFRTEKMIKAIKEKVRKINPFLVIPFTYYPNVVAGNVFKESTSKISIWNQRDIGIEGFNENIFEKNALKNASFFITNSGQAKDFLLTKNVPSAKIKVIKNSLKPGKPAFNRTEWRKKMMIEENDLVVLKLSNIQKNKDHLTALKAFNELYQSRQDQKLKLVFAGRIDQKSVEPINDFIRENNLEDQVKIIGYTNDSLGLISASDVFLFSSYSEGSPNVVLEALSVGIPLVSSNLPSVKELAGSDYPYFFSPGDFKECARMLDTLIDNNSSTVFEKLKERINQEHNLEAITKRYVETISAYTS